MFIDLWRRSGFLACIKTRVIALLLVLLTSLEQRDTMLSRLDVSCYSATLTSAATS